MTLLKLLPVILSSLLLAAHFLRSGDLLFVLISLGFPFLLMKRQPWAVRIVQVMLVLGGLEWIRTLLILATERIQANQPWARMGVILLAVALWTAGSLFVFWDARLRALYGLDTRPGRPDPSASE